MHMRVCTLASGSSGNATLVVAGKTALLIDVGISARRITTALRALGYEPGALSGILITHEHSDHIQGLRTMHKHFGIPVYTTAATARQLCYRIAFLEDSIRPVTPGQGVEIGEVGLVPFATPHDAADSVGFTLESGGCRMSLASDLGHVTQEVLDAVTGSDLLIAESNYDSEMLRDGPYPYYLKKRIQGERGHLSNEDGARLVTHAAVHGTRTVVLGHLSQENNTPLRAREASARALRAAGVDPERALSLSVAPRGECSGFFELARGGDVRAFRLREAGQC